MANSANVANYYIGKGVVKIKRLGIDNDYRDVGNVPEFEFTPEVEELEHFSSREGTRTKDRTVAIEKSASLRLVMEEWTAANLALALMGTPEENTAGQIEISIFSENAISCSVLFVGANDVGPRWQLEFPRVDFLPSSALNPISDEWGQIEVTGDVVVVDGSFGTATKLANEDGDEETEELASEINSDDSGSDSAANSDDSASDSDNP